jgi:hypothetical protein
MAIKISEYTQELTTFDTPETIKQEVSMETSPSVWETKWYSWATLKASIKDFIWLDVVTTVTVASTDDEIPTAKAVYDAIAGITPTIPTLDEVTTAGAETTNRIIIGDVTTIYNQYQEAAINHNDNGNSTLLQFTPPTGSNTINIQDGSGTLAFLSDLPVGGGDVVGPASAVDNNIATFDGTTGKLIQDGGTTIADINTNAVDRVTVKLSQSINKGQAVYISSANGTNIIVSKADNTSEATSSKTIGLLETSGAINAIVNVVTSGLLDGLDTSTATIGDPVWLGTSGNLIYGLASKPFAPAHLVYIGVVSRVHATVGEILVKVQNGFELKEIHDVDVLSVAPANKDVLQYESATSLWKNKALTDTFTLTSYNGSWTAPADSTTYYLPLTGGIAVPLTTITTFLNTFTFGIKIFGILVQNIGSAVSGTGENVTIGIRNNTDGVNSSLINIQTNQASGVAKNFEDYSLNVDIPANKAIAMYITTPAWVTNPTNVIIRIT